jgi:hypothetical protein
VDVWGGWACNIYGPATDRASHLCTCAARAHFFYDVHSTQAFLAQNQCLRSARAPGRLFVPPVPQQCSMGLGGPLGAFVHGAIDVEGPQQIPNLGQVFRFIVAISINDKYHVPPPHGACGIRTSWVFEGGWRWRALGRYPIYIFPY